MSQIVADCLINYYFDFEAQVWRWYAYELWIQTLPSQIVDDCLVDSYFTFEAQVWCWYAYEL